MNIRYKTTITKCNLFFFKYTTKIRKGQGLHLHDVWKIPVLHWTRSRIDGLSFITVVPSYYHFFRIAQLHRFDFVLSWNFISRAFSLFYDLIASYYTKWKWQWRQGYLFCFVSYYFDKEMILYICLFLSVWSEEFT